MNDRDIPDVEPTSTVPDVTVDLTQNFPTSFGPIDVVAELTNMEHAVELYRKLTAVSIKATRPQDWLEFGGKMYLQTTGVERLTPIWGLVFGSPEVTKINHPDGTFSYLCRGPVGCRKTGVIYQGVEGGRWSGDGFFDKTDDRGNSLPIDEFDVRKAAFANWVNRGARMLMGLGNLTAQDLSDSGVSGVGKVQFRTGGKGGGSKVDMTEDGSPIVPYGPCAKQPLDKMGASDLKEYRDRAKAQLASEDYQKGGEKYKWRKNTEKWLGIFMDEVERRRSNDEWPSDLDGETE